MQETLTLLSFGPDGWGDQIASGVLVTVGLALATLPLGLVVGFLLALAQQSDEGALRMAAEIYTTIFRGLPELLTLFLVYFGLQIGIRQLLLAIGYESALEINSFLAGMIALGVVFSAFASEVFLSAFRAIPAGQYEGGYALGLGKTLTMIKIILPQLIRIALPASSGVGSATCRRGYLSALTVLASSGRSEAMPTTACLMVSNCTG